MALDITDIRDRRELEEAIVGGYEDEEQRELALEALRASDGVDLITGLPIETEEKPPEKPDSPPDADTKAEEEAAAAKKAEEEAAAAKAAEEAAAAKKAEEDAAAAAAAKKDETTDADPAKAEGEPSGVASPDGSKVLPYSVLQETARELEKARAQNEAYERLIQGGDKAPGTEEGGDKPGGGDTAKVEVKPIETPAFDKNIDTIRQTFGDEVADTLKETVDVLKASNTDMAERLAASRAENEQWRVDQTAQQQQQSADDVTAAIHSNPDLAAWHADHLAAARGEQGKDDTRWKQAIRFDDNLADDPAWAGKPLAERFGEAVRLVKVLRGDSAESGTPSKESTEEEARKAAAAAKKAEEEGKKPPTSMTDLPPGEQEKNDDQTLENMPPAKVAELGVDKIDELLAARMG